MRLVRRLPVIAVALTVALGVAGCGGSSGKKKEHASSNTTAALQLPPPREKPSAGEAGGGSSTSSSGPSTSAAPATTAVPAGDFGPQQFQSPSGNIGCFIDTSSARCDIRQRAWNPPAKPPGCDLDYGQGIQLSGDHADFVCAGDTTLGQGPPLPFGSSSKRGTLICDSASTGVTCHDTRDGHGFFIARESYRLF